MSKFKKVRSIFHKKPQKMSFLQTLAEVFIHLFFFIGITGSFYLVYNQFTVGDTCPFFLGVPVCYLIWSFFTFLYFMHIYLIEKRVFLIFLAFPLTIATFASIGEIFGIVECPTTSGGIPMCYISFMLFLGLAILKMYQKKFDLK